MGVNKSPLLLIPNLTAEGSLSMADTDAISKLASHHTVTSTLSNITNNYAASSSFITLSSPEDQLENIKRQQILRERLVGVIVAGTLALWVLAAFIINVSGGVAVDIAAIIFVSVLSPTTLLQQRYLTKQATLRQELNNIRQEINTFMSQNKELKEQSLKVQSQVDKLSNIEKQLQSKAEAQGTNVSTLMNNVKENATLVFRIKECLKAEVFHSVCEVLTSTDRDSNFVLDEDEKEILVVKLSMIDGVHFNESLFRNTFPGKMTMKEVGVLLKNLVGAGRYKEVDVVNDFSSNIFTFDQPQHLSIQMSTSYG